MDNRRGAHRAQRHWHTGVAHSQARQWDAAAAAFERASTLAPDDALVWINLARAQLRSHQAEAAVESASRAFSLDPASPLACRILADSFAALHRYSEAADCFDHLAPNAPRDHDLLASQGLYLFHANRLQDAIEAYFRALAVKIDSPRVHYWLGLVFQDMQLKEEAAECFRTAATLDKGNVGAMALAMLVHESGQACRWESRAEDTAALHLALRSLNGTSASVLAPFTFLALDSTPAEQLRAGALLATALGLAVPRLAPLPAIRAPGRIRLGYLSSDFHNHATAVLMAELLEQRNSKIFEVFLYSHSRHDGSALQHRVQSACDHFVDVNALDNGSIARRIRSDNIDILIDLKGHTRGTRFGILAARPARVQVSYLGYPGTTGADYIDYVVGDPVVTPLESAADFSERIAQMPWSYQPNDRQRVLPESPGREVCDLPKGAVVLCCFNQAYKINPEVLDAWTRILRDAPHAILWLLAWNDQAERNLRLEFARRGIEADRIRFAKKVSMEEHIARLRCADLFLDTWPCNAHTTASESLWAGVPVLTVPGNTFASRVAASLARATRTDSLVCSSIDDYVARAVELANDRQSLDRIRHQLDADRMSLPLFDSRMTTRELEALYIRMHERAERGMKPEHLPARILDSGAN